MFDTTTAYTRMQIQKLVGGELQSYLPQKNKRILAGCFNRTYNPDCPEQIQAGKAKKVVDKAELLISQPDNVFPVFVKEGKSSRTYSFIGYFRCTGGRNDPGSLRAAEMRSGRHGALSYVFNLAPVAGEG